MATWNGVITNAGNSLLNEWVNEKTLNFDSAAAGQGTVAAAAMLMDQIGDKKNTEENWVNEMALKDAIKRLPDREKEIIKLRYFDGKTQMEVSKMVRISQAQVSRLEKSAIKNMENYLRRG